MSKWALSLQFTKLEMVRDGKAHCYIYSLTVTVAFVGDTKMFFPLSERPQTTHASGIPIN